MTRLSKKLFLLGSPLFIGLLVLMISGLAMADATEPVPDQVISPVPKIVYGSVNTNSHEPVSNALVTAHRIHRFGRARTLTAADGSYQLALGAGLWALSVEMVNATTPGEWIYPHEPQHVEFLHNNQPERHELNFTVIAADAGIKGAVAMPDGSPPPFTVTIGLHNGEGIGRRVNADPVTGAFRIALPHGRYDVVVHPHHDRFMGPHLEPVHLPPGQVVDLGQIKLIPLNGRITGTATDEHGNGVEGIPITAWQRDRFDAITTRTGPGGVYSLAVSRGVWHVQPSPGPDSRYLYLGGGKTVWVAAGETVSDVDFELLTAGSTIVGILVTLSDVHVSDLDGWATAVNSANPNIHNGAPIESGRFAIHIPRGDYLVSTHLPPGSPYLSTADIPVSVGAGETVTITIPLRKKDAAIVGALVDPRQNRNPVTGVEGAVSAWSDHLWATTHIRPDSGSYRLEVAAGVWRLNYRIKDEEYVKLGGGANIPVQSGQTVHWPLPITRRDAAISGRVLTPDGGPLAGAMVIADGLSGEISGLWLRTRTDDQGRFRLNLPHGRYRVGAAGGAAGWINPFQQVIAVAPSAVLEHITLQFRKPNAVINGGLTVLNTTEEGEVLVWAWSERGGFTKGRFPVWQTGPGGQATGRYRLGVVSGTTWHVGAIFETDDAYWVGRTVTKVPGPTASVDLALTGPHPKPPPVVVTFDASHAQRLTLADGTRIFIPAGAMPVTGRVTLRIVPIATLPHQRHAQIVRYGYAFFATDELGRPIEEQFNHNVLIRFKYDEHHLHGWERHIKPAYFSTTTNEWTFPEHYVVNPARNIVTMEIDHFTHFALVEAPAQPAVFLPLVIGGCGATNTSVIAPAPCSVGSSEVDPSQAEAPVP
jgi:hypothetical protein